ncbi:MAG TPA: hypothetical protein VI729_11740, partial [Anaerolineales bacterium]|nr:hypothetical protein [Anaerolineales bacterium]
DYIVGAKRAYEEVCKHKECFLADDAQGWVGGCYYRMGEYTEALKAYIVVKSAEKGARRRAQKGAT